MRRGWLPADGARTSGLSKLNSSSPPPREDNETRLWIEALAAPRRGNLSRARSVDRRDCEGSKSGGGRPPGGPSDIAGDREAQMFVQQDFC